MGKSQRDDSLLTVIEAIIDPVLPLRVFQSGFASYVDIEAVCKEAFSEGKSHSAVSVL
jgi:hypothetical protein